MAKKHVISEQKKKLVDEFAKLMIEYPIIAVVNMEGLPTPQLQNMRASLRQKVVLKMCKWRIMSRAIEKAKDKKNGIENLMEHIKKGMPALLFTKENPFILYKTIKKSKSKAPAKPGQTATNNITIQAGPTQFSPGPIISEFGGLGIKTGVENGKIVIKEDKLLVSEGEVISAKAASMLSKLNILPMEIGLNLVAAYEDGVIYTKSVLDVDEEQFMSDLGNCARWANNLALEAGYVIKENVHLFIGKAFNDAKALAISQDILCSATVGNVLAKAESQAASVKDAAKL